MTVLVDSQVSDRCPWATCLFFLFVNQFTKFFVALFGTFGMQLDVLSLQTVPTY